MRRDHYVMDGGLCLGGSPWWYWAAWEVVGMDSFENVRGTGSYKYLRGAISWKPAMDCLEFLT